MSSTQKILGWAILIVCLISLPVGLLSKGKRDPKTADESSSSRLSFLAGRDRLQVVRLAGMIYDDEDSQSSIFPDPSSPTTARKTLRKAATNNNIKGILLRINSPGGTVATSQEIYDAVKEVRAKGKPVIVSMGDVAASGGYYIAAAADKIYADPGTLTGSIGVIMHLLNLEEIEKKIGVKPEVIKSGAFKDIGTMDRAMTQAEKDLLHSIIMDSYDQFVSAVANGRSMPKDTVKKLADGRIYSGRQAKDVKLVDELGGYEEAKAALQKASRAKYKHEGDLPIDEGNSSMSFISGLFAEAGESSSSIGNNLIKGVLPVSLQQRFHKQPLWLME